MTENREILYDDWAVREITKPRIRDIILFSGVLLLLFVIAIVLVTSLVSDGLWTVALVCFLRGVYGGLDRKHSHLIISEGEIVITNWLKRQKRYEVELSNLTLKISSNGYTIYEFFLEDGRRLCCYKDHINQKSVYGDSAWEMRLKSLPLAGCEGI